MIQMQHSFQEAAVALRGKGFFHSSAVLQSGDTVVLGSHLFSKVASAFPAGFSLLLLSTDLCCVWRIFLKSLVNTSASGFMHGFTNRLHSECESLCFYPWERKALIFHLTAYLELLITFIQISLSKDLTYGPDFPDRNYISERKVIKVYQVTFPFRVL